MKPLRVGLTGGIGAGKSEALRAFARAGAATLALDECARRLARRGGPTHRAVVRAFGPGILDAHGRLDRKALGRRVFADPASRRRLERATHPAILRAMRSWLRRARGPVRIVDAPLLFEAGLESDFDATVVVVAARRTRISRVMARDGLTRAEALRRIRAQWPAREKARRADVILTNDGTVRTLRRKAASYQRAFELIAKGAS